MSVLGIRGAITAENTKEDILNKTKEMFLNIIKENHIKEDELISITFSVTKDLTKVYPAVAIRELGWTSTPLFCLQEMFVEGALEKAIRVLILIDSSSLEKSDIKHIYLREASALRLDL